MVFKYSEIPLELSTYSIRYHNDLAWYYFSLLQIIPGFIVCLKQFIYRNEEIKKNQWDQWLVRIFSWPVPFYYFIDMVISIYANNFWVPCRFWLWYHHVVSMVVIPTLLYRDRYEWQDTLVLATHSLLMRWPHIFALNLIYVVVVLIFNAKLYLKPLNELRINRFLGLFFPFIYYAFIVLLAHDCNNALPNLC